MKKSHFPQINYLDGLRYQRAILAGCKEIISHEGELNKINVFPIPDKDTGSNLKKTLMPIIEKYPLWQTGINISSRGIADTAIASALGYSGIIFSQFLSGFADGVKNHKKIFIENLPKAAVMAVSWAYESLENPREGTILSVFKAWSDEVKNISSTTTDFVLLLKKSLERASSALAYTPHQLEILRKNKVVDAGGQAFIYFLEGVIRFIKKGKLHSLLSQKKQIHIKTKAADTIKKAQFCAECCVRRENLERQDLIKRLNSLGQDLIFYGSLNFAKIHINTNNPEEIFSCMAQFGNITSKKILKFAPDLPSHEKRALALVPDTTCDIPDEHIENNDIYFVPVKFQAMGKVFTDKVSIIPEEFYQILSLSPTLPKTSQPSLMDFTRIYEHLLVHYQSIISVQLSKKLSGTFQTALQAANNIDSRRITVIDGKNISVGLGLAVMEGIKAIKEGLDYEAVLKRVKRAVENTKIFIGIPTLKYLVKGGRVTKAKGFLARVLNINPILSINSEGELKPIGKTRGRKKLEQKVLDTALRKIKEARVIHHGLNLPETSEEDVGFSMAVAHTNAPQLGNRVAEKIRETLGMKVAMVMNASPVLGVHAGPGAIGVAILKKI